MVARARKEHIQIIQERVSDLIERERSNTKMMNEMDNMDYMQWDLPKELSGVKWVRKSVSSDPHDALRDGTRLFAAMEPKLNIQPLGVSEGDRERAEDIERGLRKIMLNTLKRKARIQAKIVKSAIKYDKVAFQVVYLPHQDRIVGIFKDNDRKRKHAYRNGDFAIILRDPKNVFPMYNDLMKLDGVCMRQTMSIREMEAFWGDKAKEFKKRMGLKMNEEADSVTVYDYWDFDKRLVWAIPQTGTTYMSNPNADEMSILLDVDNDLDFLPWVVEVGDTDELEPLLYSVYKGKQFNDMNILDTLALSEVLAYTSAPRAKKSGAVPEDIVVDYDSPNREVELRPGETFDPLPPPVIDQSILTMYERLRARVNKSTISNIVQTGDIKSGTAFASLNKLVELGVKSLNPYKELAEGAMVELCYIMMHWLKYDNKPLMVTAQVAGGGMVSVNQEMDMNPFNFDIRIELTADLPIDQPARVNAAKMAREALDVSKETGLTAIGIEDPKAEIEKTWLERQRDVQYTMEMENAQGDNARQEMIKNAQAEAMAQVEQDKIMMAYEAEKQAQQQQSNPPNQPQAEGRETLAQTQRDPRQQQAQKARAGAAPAGGGAGNQNNSQLNPQEQALSNTRGN